MIIIVTCCISWCSLDVDLLLDEQRNHFLLVDSYSSSLDIGQHCSHVEPMLNEAHKS